MKTKNQTLMAIVVFSLLSCDCLQKVEGVVYDSQTQKPLADVTIYKSTESYHTIKTDSEGKFSFSDIETPKNCSTVKLVFEKQNYKTDTLSFSGNITDAVVNLKK